MYSILHISSKENESLESAFRKKNMEYEHVPDNVEEIENHVQNNHVHAILIDAMQFTTRVEKILVHLRTDYQKIKFIFFLTDIQNIGLKKHLYDKGMTDYFMKSTPSDEIAEGVFNYVHNRNMAFSPKNDLKIAILEDNVDQIEMVKIILDINHFGDAEYYTQGEKLLQVNKQYDIYLVDIVLEGISGKKVIIELRKRFPEAIIIALSAIKNKALLSELITLGADDFIQKPFDVPSFISKLKNNIKRLKNKSLE